MINPAYIRCHCDQCTKLDQLPTRLQGIPGAVQATFVTRMTTTEDETRFAVEMAELEARNVSKYGNPHGPWGKPQTTADTLPLFIGALEPTLF